MSLVHVAQLAIGVGLVVVLVLIVVGVYANSGEH
jgi:hypothetical protein